ncbi:hypothetical protein [Chondrinema litorale]|uniref:hypothetical protein n=1 Tax=Chondrinema litorale TaxID=2994555 RepID=UPI0025426E34|nr:hypothetical protein [Chondrinema litorale]UZR96696.1 hypothetical protein OQ292_21355 [Chondrinema litorale]
MQDQLPEECGSDHNGMTIKDWKKYYSFSIDIEHDSYEPAAENMPYSHTKYFAKPAGKSLGK